MLCDYFFKKKSSDRKSILLVDSALELHCLPDYTMVHGLVLLDGIMEYRDLSFNFALPFLINTRASQLYHNPC